MPAIKANYGNSVTQIKKREVDIVRLETGDSIPNVFFVGCIDSIILLTEPIWFEPGLNNQSKNWTKS